MGLDSFGESRLNAYVESTLAARSSEKGPRWRMHVNHSSEYGTSPGWPGPWEGDQVVSEFFTHTFIIDVFDLWENAPAEPINRTVTAAHWRGRPLLCPTSDLLVFEEWEHWDGPGDNVFTGYYTGYSRLVRFAIPPQPCLPIGQEASEFEQTFITLDLIAEPYREEGIIFY